MFKDNNVEEGYPRPVSDFSLPPGGIDAVFSWAHNDRTYFFKDQLYWRYDDHTRRMDPGYPAQGPLWRGVPSMLDDAMRWSDGEHQAGDNAVLACSLSVDGVWGRDSLNHRIFHTYVCEISEGSRTPPPWLCPLPPSTHIGLLFTPQMPWTSSLCIFS